MKIYCTGDAFFNVGGSLTLRRFNKRSSIPIFVRKIRLELFLLSYFAGGLLSFEVFYPDKIGSCLSLSKR